MLGHCHRDDINSPIGQFLSGLRLTKTPTSQQRHVLQHDLGRDLDNADTIILWVDRHGDAEPYTCTDEHEEMQELDDSRCDHDEKGRRCSLSASLPAVVVGSVVRLAIGARVLCAQRLDKHACPCMIGVVSICRFE